MEVAAVIRRRHSSHIGLMARGLLYLRNHVLHGQRYLLIAEMTVAAFRWHVTGCSLEALDRML